MNPGDKVRVKTRPERTGMVIKTEMDHGHLDVLIRWDKATADRGWVLSWTFADQLEAL